MKTGIYFLIQSLFFSVLLIIVYFNKKRLENLETKIYSYLIITSVIELLLELVLDAIMPIYEKNIPLSTFLAKTYCVVILVWLSLLINYVTSISLILKNKNKNMELVNKIYIIITIINSLLIYVLPIKFYYNETIYYTYGPSVNIDYIISFLYSFVGIICLIWNRKNIKNKKYLPLFIFIIIGGITGYIQMKNPSLLLSTAVHSFITFLMYFTIENPDMQMVEELNKNRKLTEQNFEEKTNFIFKISQDLKKPLSDIANLSNNIIENSKENIKDQAIIINNNAKQLYTYVNNALDVSNMDIKNLKIVNSTYNTRNFFEELKLRIQTEIKKQNKNIEFRCNIAKNIPELLSGDNTKLKQIILSVAFDSIKHTKDGFIELNVNSIVKYGVCRLMIEILDSGEGMQLEKINSILSATGDLTKEEIEKIDKLNITLSLAHKIIKTLNGSFIIKSEVDQGTNFLIIIDQKIEEKKQSKKIEIYSSKITTSKKILIVSIDNIMTDKITKQLEKENIETVKALYGKDCINKLEQNEKYELILIDDELNNESGIELLKEIKEKTTLPILVLLNKNKEFIAKHYIEDGFTNYIIKENIEEELKKISKYL